MAIVGKLIAGENLDELVPLEFVDALIANGASDNEGDQEPYDIPRTFPVHAWKEVLDYDFQKIGDSEFLVPLKVVLTSRSDKYFPRMTSNSASIRNSVPTRPSNSTKRRLREDKVKEKQ